MSQQITPELTILPLMNKDKLEMSKIPLPSFLNLLLFFPRSFPSYFSFIFHLCDVPQPPPPYPLHQPPPESSNSIHHHPTVRFTVCLVWICCFHKSTNPQIPQFCTSAGEGNIAGEIPQFCTGAGEGNIVGDFHAHLPFPISDLIILGFLIWEKMMKKILYQHWRYC